MSVYLSQQRLQIRCENASDSLIGKLVTFVKERVKVSYKTVCAHAKPSYKD